MKIARIYQYDSSVTQSALSDDQRWFVQLPVPPKEKDALMGWLGSSDTDQYVDLVFSDLEKAKEYVTSLSLDYVVLPRKNRSIVPKSYLQTLKNNLK